MATFRTPSAIFHPSIAFYSNGELGSDSVLNRAPFALDDKAQYLKETQDSEITKGTALASKIGEVYDTSVVVTWNVPTNFTQGDSHHTAIEKLDAVVSALPIITNTTRLNNLDTLKLGEDSNSATAPDWSTTRSPFYVQIGDNHHTAIERLDIGASILRSEVNTHETRLDALDSKVFTTLTPNLATAEAAIGTLQTNQGAISVLQQSHVTAIAANLSQITLTRTEVSLVSQAVVTNDALTSLLQCKMVTVESQINVLRAFHTPPLLGPIANFCP